MNPQIKVGADPFPPYQYYEGECLRGSDYEVVKAAFEAAGYDITVELYDWPVVEKKFNEGEYAACFQVQPTPERVKKYCFSDLLREAATEVITAQQELKLSSYQEIEKKRFLLGVIEGYTNGAEIDALSEQVKKAYPDTKSLLLAISRGEVDVGVFDRGVKNYLMEQNQIKNLYVVKGMTFYRPLHVVFLDASLCRSFNAGLAVLRSKM